MTDLLSLYQGSHPSSTLSHYEIVQAIRKIISDLRQSIIRQEALPLGKNKGLIDWIIKGIEALDTPIPKIKKVYDGSGFIDRELLLLDGDIPSNIKERAYLILQGFFGDSDISISVSPYRVLKRVINLISGIQVPIKRVDSILLELLKQSGIEFTEIGTANHFKKSDLISLPLLLPFSYHFKMQGFTKEPEWEDYEGLVKIFFSPFIPLRNPEEIEGLFPWRFLSGFDIVIMGLPFLPNASVIVNRRDKGIDIPELEEPFPSTYFGVYSLSRMIEEGIDILSPQMQAKDREIYENAGFRITETLSPVYKASPYLFNDLSISSLSIEQ